MTTGEYYSRLRARHAATNWSSLESIRAYNEYARSLRSELYAERDARAEAPGISEHRQAANVLRNDSGLS